ncbi:MAG: hypothetical protein V4641_28165 [Pseudomonadota bacterium]
MDDSAQDPGRGMKDIEMTLSISNLISGNHSYVKKSPVNVKKAYIKPTIVDYNPLSLIKCAPAE